MYADRVESGTKRSIRDRLNGNLDDDFVRSRQSSGKRQCQTDDKWKHDLYMDKGGSQISARVGSEDLRAKLQNKSMQRSYQGGRESGVRDLSGKPTGKLPVPLKAELVPEPTAPPKATRMPEPTAPPKATRMPEPTAPPKATRMPEPAAPPKATRMPEPTAQPKAKSVPGPPAQLKSKSVPDGVKPVQKHVSSVEEMVPDTKKVPASTSSRKKKRSGSSVDGLLKSLGLEKYSLTFQAEEVDMAALRYMTEDDLRTLGIPMGPRKKILLALDTKA